MKKMSKYADNLIALDDRAAYMIAREADMHFTTLSQLRRGIALVKDEYDPRIIRLSKVLGIPEIEMLEDVD